MNYFDYEQAAREAGIPDDRLNELMQLMRDEFPQDDMMWELHILRACLAVRDGQATVDEILSRRAA